MARSEVTLTSDWQLLSSTAATITVASAESGAQICLNQTESTTAAMVDVARVGEQYVQTEAKDVYAYGSGVTVIVDSEDE